MKLLILGADSLKEMNEISEELVEKKFIFVSQEEDFVLMRKRRYGNPLIHVVSLLIACFAFSLFIFVNVAYFMYSYIWASPQVLITTEKFADNGEPLEFSDMDEVLRKANAIL